LFQHNSEQATLDDIDLLLINGFDDHVHLLLRLHASQPLSAVVQQIKGESARWANQVSLLDMTLKWATGYYARSVSPDEVRIVTRYISSQPDKHTQSIQWLDQYLQGIPSDKEES
jgi:putative transposase